MKLRLSEFKYKAIAGIEGLVDTYFPSITIPDRALNATIKIIVRQNADKLDNMIELFADKDGMVDVDMMIAEYGKAFGADKIIIDLRDFVNNDTIKKILPNKALAIQVEDLARMFEK